MKGNRYNFLRKGMLWVFLFYFALSAHATIITFDPAYTPSAIPDDYASRVDNAGFDVGSRGPFDLTHGATPNIAVTMFSASASRGRVNTLFRWGSGYGSLTYVAYHANGQYALFRFTADPGYWARLHAFKMAGWPNTNRTLPLLEIRVDNTVVFSQTNILITGTGYNLFSFDPNVYKGSVVEIFFGNDWNVGIDDIEFSQEVIPEPASWLILFTGLTGLISRLHTRKS